MENNLKPAQSHRNASSDSPSALSLLDWAMSDLGRKAFRMLKASSGNQPIWLEVVGLKEDQSASQLIGRLGDLGFQPGEPISVLGHAPLGEPLFIEVRETVLALRSEEASFILVRTTPVEGS